jgi:GxxExxY protein
MSEPPEEKIASDVLDFAYRVHTELGPGLLESAYQKVLVYLLVKQGYEVETEVPIPVHFDGIDHGTGYRADIVVNGKVLIELKSVEELSRLHFKQVITYLKLANLRLGLLINFNAEHLKGNIRRVVNGLK